MKKQFGIGLLELMLTLAVILAILLVAARYYRTTRTAQRINEASQMVNAVYVATMNYAHNNVTSEDLIPIFVNNGSLPKIFEKSTVNPWGGAVTATSVNQLQQVRITLTHVPFEACNNLTQKFKTKADVELATCFHTIGGGIGSAIIVFNVLAQSQLIGVS